MLKIKPKNNIKQFNKKKACLGISLDSTNHAGENLRKIIDFINDNFDSLIIDLSDTLYTHHYMATGISHAEAYYKSRAEGDKWIKKHSDILNEITVPFQIIRWDQWTSDSDYKAISDEFYTLFEENTTFKNAVVADIKQYYKRKLDINIDNVSYNSLRSSIAYIIEEISCHTILTRQYPDVTVVYPGKQLESYKVIRNGIVTDAPSGIETTKHLRLCLYETQNTSSIAA